MRALREYSDASHCTTYPKPMTDFEFLGLGVFENIEFKIWLGLIGKCELEVAADQITEIHMVEAFKNQKNKKCQYSNPAQKSALIHMWFLQAEADKALCATVYNCEFWQLVQHAPTQEEFSTAFPELEYAPPIAPAVKSEPVTQTKVKAKWARSEINLDLFEVAV